VSNLPFSHVRVCANAFATNLELVSLEAALLLGNFLQSFSLALLSCKKMNLIIIERLWTSYRKSTLQSSAFILLTEAPVLNPSEFFLSLLLVKPHVKWTIVDSRLR
jgi:hypothetical protein